MDNKNETKIENRNIKSVAITKEMESSFIDYAMSVIVSRAIPDARDGLKPVHRRILYAMDQLDLPHNKAFKKSARTVGEVIAKYHPHGDSAVYESLVRMAQPFSMRYPLIWGQGNFGSVDGDSAAAMRYTEAKLHKISTLLLDDIKKDTVDFQNNYDDSETEPKVLPAKIPNLLLNGTTGIAVGMATSIPPHNITEVLNAAIALAHNPDLNLLEIMQYISAPDFPTGGIIVNKNEIPAAYKTGRGRIIVRSKVEISFDEIKNAGKFVITEIPFMVNKSNLILKIADLVKNKIITSIADIRDESSRLGIRIVIRLKRNFIPEVELNKLFKLTPLQSNFPINLVALVNERPRTLSLKEALVCYIDHQLDILVRKTFFLLKKAEARIHILLGLKIALDNVDAFIAILKESPDNYAAATKLISTFKLSEIQAKAILTMQFQRLTGLEQHNILKEIDNLKLEIKDHNLVVNNEEVQIERITKMMKEILEQYGDERRTAISADSLASIDDEDLIPIEDIVVTLTNKGYIKRLPIADYRSQNRGGQGSKGVTTNDGDFVTDILITNTHTDILFFSSLGKVYRLRGYQIHQYGKVAKGLPVVNLINLQGNEFIKSVISIDNYQKTDLFFTTKKGIVKKTASKEFERVQKNGKIALFLKPGDQLLKVVALPNDKPAQIVLGNSNGKAIRFLSTNVRTMGRSAAGVHGMSIGDGEIVDYAAVVNEKLILSVSEKGFGKLTNLEQYRIQARAGKGVRTLNTEKAGKLVGLRAVQGDEDLLLITDKGTVIRTSLDQISNFSRNTKGVTIVRPKEDEKIVSIATIKSLKEMEHEIIEKTQEQILEPIKKEL